MSRVPIRLRVTAAFAFAMAAVLAASGLFLYFRLASHLATALDTELRLRSQDLAALVRDRGSLERDSGSSLVERGESYAQLLDAHGRVLDATPPLGHVPALTPSQVLRALNRPLYAERSSVPGLDEPSRLLAAPARRAGRTDVLVVGATLQDRAETLAAFRNELVIAGPVALVVASLLGYLLAGLSLRQVDSMRRRAAAISAQTAGERLPVPPTGDELQRLGETLNEMLARLEAGLERERDFVADAGHELRTPLALLRTELELALRHGESVDELRQAIARSSDEADRLARLADDLLLIARVERGRLPLRYEAIDAADLAQTVAERFAGHDQVTVDVPPGVVVEGDRLRLEQALGNLVDNAFRHGGGSVTLSAAEADGTVELHVRDEGDGFAAGFVDEAFERFTRQDHARPRGGAGLGLPIARAVAEAHGGVAGAANGEHGGADVWLALPAATYSPPTGA